ncbi:MAG: histidine kinase [Actinocatenispora sp.]
MTGEQQHDTWRPPRPRPVAVAGVLAVVTVLTALTVWARYASHPTGTLVRVDLAVGLVSVLLAPISLWRPVTGTFALTVLATLSPAATPAATVGVLQVAERRRFPVAVAMAAAGILAHVVQGLWRPPDGISFAWWLALTTVAYAALVGWGALARARRAILMSLRDRARRAEAEQGRRVAEARMLERTRLARDMHDVLAHRLSLLATYAGALEYRPDAPPEQLSRAAGVVRAGVHQALDELREVITLLRDEEADDGYDGASHTLADISRLVEESRSAGATVRVSDEVADPAGLPAATGRTVYRVVQEALTNARRHAPGRTVRVALAGRAGDRLTIEVRNPLPDPAAAAPVTAGTGTGLIGLTERVHLAGGRLDHEVTDGEFRLSAWLPWPA